jgi:Rrf2 family protein
MNLKNQVEWALHCCAILSMLPEGRYLSTKALAEFHGVPKEYLSKAMQGLSRAGLVETTLGPAGGYRLSRDAVLISVLEIVEAVEGRKSTFACYNIRANNPCRPKDYCDSKPCSIAKVMWQADEAWRQSLAGVRLADILDMVVADVPADQLQTNADWVMARAG